MPSRRKRPCSPPSRSSAQSSALPRKLATPLASAASVNCAQNRTDRAATRLRPEPASPRASREERTSPGTQCATPRPRARAMKPRRKDPRRRGSPRERPRAMPRWPRDKEAAASASDGVAQHASSEPAPWPRPGAEALPHASGHRVPPHGLRSRTPGSRLEPRWPGMAGARS